MIFFCEVVEEKMLKFDLEKVFFSALRQIFYFAHSKFSALTQTYIANCKNLKKPHTQN